MNNPMIDWEIFHDTGVLYDVTFAPFRRERVPDGSIGKWKAIEIFGRGALQAIAMDKVRDGEDGEGEFARCLERVQTFDDGDFQIRVSRARAADLNHVAASLGLQPRGGFIKSPFSGEKTASCKLYPAGRGFYCYSSNRAGSAIDFVMAVTGRSFSEAVSYLQLF